MKEMRNVNEEMKKWPALALCARKASVGTLRGDRSISSFLHLHFSFLISHFSFTKFLSFLLFVSCTQDVYEKGDGEYSLMQADLVLAHANSEKEIDFVDTDEGERLRVTTPFTESWVVTADSTYRASFYYKRTEQGAVPVALNRVLVLEPHPWKNLKTDPVKMESCWLSTNKAYLNLGVYLLVGTPVDKEAKHQLGSHLVEQVYGHDGKKMAYLQLYHNQNGMPEYYSYRTYMSIPLAGLTADSLTITINTYDGVVVKKFGL